MKPVFITAGVLDRMEHGAAHMQSVYAQRAKTRTKRKTAALLEAEAWIEEVKRRPKVGK